MAIELSSLTFTDQADIVPVSGWKKYAILAPLILLLAMI